MAAVATTGVDVAAAVANSIKISLLVHDRQSCVYGPRGDTLYICIHLWNVFPVRGRSLLRANWHVDKLLQAKMSLPSLFF